MRCGGLAGYVVNEATHYERPEAGGKALEGTFSLRRRKPEAAIEVHPASVT
ncbi:MAG: hypothetical protein ACUVYA_02550 [Planctomycetota bacterium]